MSGSWQTRLADSSKELTAFTDCPLEFYENRLLFGLCNSEANLKKKII